MIREIYVVRAYAENGNLLSPKLRGAVLHDPVRARERLCRMMVQNAIVTAKGSLIPVPIDSLCVHGDTLGAVELAR